MGMVHILGSHQHVMLTGWNHCDWLRFLSHSNPAEHVQVAKQLEDGRPTHAVAIQLSPLVPAGGGLLEHYMPALYFILQHAERRHEQNQQQQQQQQEETILRDAQDRAAASQAAQEQQQPQQPGPQAEAACRVKLFTLLPTKQGLQVNHITVRDTATCTCLAWVFTSAVRVEQCRGPS